MEIMKDMILADLTARNPLATRKKKLRKPCPLVMRPRAHSAYPAP
jgi:hypothetical protein